MNPTEFWQNFKLGEEQEIACNFIYDGLRNLHEMDTLSHETEIFPVLYNLSIGIERLFKVAIVLLEVDDNTDVDIFEATLVTHNHNELCKRVKNKVPLNFGSVHTDFLNLLSVFYKDHRYGRFNLPQRSNLTKDKKLFHDFLKKHIQIDITEDFPLTCVWNSVAVKKFVGKIVKKITKNLYSIIDQAAIAKNLYTYEISSSSSKAAKILWGGDGILFDFEETAMIEVLAFLMKTKESTLMDVIKEIEPLQLDPALDSEYLQFLLKKRTEYLSSIIGQIEDCHADMPDLKARLALINAVKDPKVIFE
jgi:hypothetical protein